MEFFSSGSNVAMIAHISILHLFLLALHKNTAITVVIFKGG